jgi:VanZ family protein
MNTMAYVFELFRRSRLVQDWAPVLLWMAGIFYFSSRHAPLGFVPASPGQRVSVGKMAHFVEYAGLAILLYRALAGRQQQIADSPEQEKGSNLDNQIPMAKAVIGPQRSVVSSAEPSVVVFTIAFAYAILDELHQEFVPGRGFDLFDIGYDLAGMTAALGLIWLWNHRAQGGAASPRPP